MFEYRFEEAWKAYADGLTIYSRLQFCDHFSLKLAANVDSFYVKHWRKVCEEY